MNFELRIAKGWAVTSLNAGTNYFRNLSCKQAPLSLYQGMELRIFKIVLKGVTITSLVGRQTYKKNDKNMNAFQIGLWNDKKNV